MGLLGNGFRHNLTGRITAATTSIDGGNAACLPASYNLTAFRRNMMAGGAFSNAKYIGVPVGVSHPTSWLLPQSASYMSMRTTGAGNLAADLIPTRPMTIDMTGSGDLAATAALVVSMVCAMTGSGSLTATITGLLDMSCDLDGSGDLAADMSGIASMAVDLLGEGDLSATIAAYGDMTIDIVVTGTGLSTANVGAAVWNALAASFNTAGTMGNKLNSASAAGDPWTAVIPGSYAPGEAGNLVGNALADIPSDVWTKAIEAGFTAEELMRIFAAVLAGKVSGAGSGTETFVGVDGTTDRVVSTVDDVGNRSAVSLDGS